MNTMGNITVADSQATPANHVLSSIGSFQPGAARWEERHSSGLAAAATTLVFSVKPADAKNTASKQKVTLTLTIPDVALVGGVQTVVGTSDISVTVRLDQRSTSQTRKDLVKELIQLLTLSSNSFLGDNIAEYRMPTGY